MIKFNKSRTSCVKGSLSILKKTKTIDLFMLINSRLVGVTNYYVFRFQLTVVDYEPLFVELFMGLSPSTRRTVELPLVN